VVKTVGLKSNMIHDSKSMVSIYPHQWAYNTLAVELSMSPSEVHAAVKEVSRIFRTFVLSSSS
jgi:hypothetical protein